MPNIDPIQLPSAAGVEFSGGDVRHLSQSDELSIASISTATRNLAARDNTVAQKLNELISVVNNKEQYIPVPIVRTLIPPSTLETVSNFRIPTGYEARILNATVTSIPASSPVVLSISWSSSFGSTTGTSVIDTLSEAEAGTSFFGAGEFVIQLNNTGAATAEVVASVLLTLRPIGTAQGGLIGPGAVGPQGPIGPQGGAGGTGSQGSAGPAGSPGLVWRGNWASGSSYLKNDVSRYNFGGSGFSSYVALVPNSNSAPPDPVSAPNGVWDLVAESGAAVGTPGSDGAPGATGINFRNTWSSGGSYTARDLVLYSSGSYNRTFFANGSVPVGVPPTNSANWVEFFGPSTPVVRTSISPNGKYTTSGADIAFGTPDPYYGTLAPGTNVSLPFTETAIAIGDPKILSLQLTTPLIFKGTVRFDLPQISDGATTNWNCSTVRCNVFPHFSNFSGQALKVEYAGASKAASSGYIVKCSSSAVERVDIKFEGQAVA